MPPINTNQASQTSHTQHILMDKNKSIANKTSEVMSQCININNAYKGCDDEANT